MAMAQPQGVQASRGAAGTAEGAELRLLLERLELLNTQRALASMRKERLMDLIETARAATSSSPAASSSSPSPPAQMPTFSSPSPPLPHHLPATFPTYLDAAPPCAYAAGSFEPQRPFQRPRGARDSAFQPQFQAQPQPKVECGDVRPRRRLSADLPLRRAEEIWASRGDATADRGIQARGRQRSRRPRASLDLQSLPSSASPTTHTVFSAAERTHVVSSGARTLGRGMQHSQSGRRASLDMPRSNGSMPVGHHHSRACPASTSGAVTEEAHRPGYIGRTPSNTSGRHSISSTPSSRGRRTVSFDMDSMAAQYYGDGPTKKCPSPSPSTGAPHARSPWSSSNAPRSASNATSPWSQEAAMQVGPVGVSPSAGVSGGGTVPRVGAEASAQYYPGAEASAQYYPGAEASALSYPAPEWVQGGATPLSPGDGNWLRTSPGAYPRELTFSSNQWQQLMSSNASVRVIDADACDPDGRMQGGSGSADMSWQSTSPPPELLLGSGMDSRSSSHSPGGTVNGSGCIMGLPLRPQDVQAFLEHTPSDWEAETSGPSDPENFLGTPSRALVQRRK